MKPVIHFLSSVKLAIVLLILITLALILGTMVPQNRSLQEYESRFGGLAPLLVQLEVTRLYRSWWFVGLLFLLGINTLVCTLTRFFPKRRRFLAQSSISTSRRSVPWLFRVS